MALFENETSYSYLLEGEKKAKIKDINRTWILNKSSMYLLPYQRMQVVCISFAMLNSELQVLLLLLNP